MNGAVTPAIIAAGGGSVMLASIYLHERRRDEAMRASRVRLAVRFPAGLEPLRAFAVLDAFSGLPLDTEVVAEASASEDGITHGLWVPATVCNSVEATLRGVIPSIRLAETPTPDSARATLSLRVFISTPAVLHSEGAVESSRALLAGLTTLGAGEQVAIRWALRVGGPRRLPTREPQTQTEKEIDKAWRRKTSVPGMRASGLVLVRAASVTRARILAGHVENVIRARRGLVGQLRITTERGNRSLVSMPRTTHSSGWLSSAETLGLLGWPIGPDVPAGLEAGGRELLVPRHVPREGRQLFVGRDASGNERPVTLDAKGGALHHLAIVGGTGTGKSTLLAGAVLSDLCRGFGGVVIDPKGPDLVNSILERVPSEHAERVVVLDPADTRPIPGLAVLAGGDPDLRADVLTGALKAIFADVWGVRSDFYARLALRTLAEVPGATFADIGALFSDPAYRRAAVARLRDHYLLTAWQNYEALSPGAQAEHVQAPVNRVMALLTRPRVRAVLASPNPRLDISRLLAERRWLLVSQSPGQLGEAAAHLIGAVVMHATWAAIEGRAALPPQQRTPVYVYADELGTLTGGVPFGFELLAERARGLGAGLTVALQTLSRIPEPTRSALLGNVGSFVSFRATAEEAPRIASQLPGLSAEDIMALRAFEVAARVGTGAGSAIVTVTGRTVPLPPPTGQAEAIREMSALRYGTPPDQPDTSVQPSQVDDQPSLGRGGRAS